MERWERERETKLKAKRNAAKKRRDDLRIRVGRHFPEKCEICDEQSDLEFAHLRPTEVSGRSRGWERTLKDILANLDAYAQLCRGCHREFNRPGEFSNAWRPYLECCAKRRALPEMHDVLRAYGEAGIGVRVAVFDPLVGVESHYNIEPTPLLPTKG